MQTLSKISTRGGVKDCVHCTVYGSYKGGPVTIARSTELQTFDSITEAISHYRHKAMMAAHNGNQLTLQVADTIESHLKQLRDWCEAKRVSEIQF